ncbi:MAG: GreA/GreB family elongation factor [Phycisphaerales bacterium]
MELLSKPEKEQLDQRLGYLIANRPVISKRIAEARELGDLKENGDYHAAREQQGIEEAEIRRLEQRLAQVKVIDDAMQKAAGGTVFIGSAVKMKDLDDDDVDMYKLVGESSGAGDYVEVTANSPMGEAMMKARVGDVIRVSAPRGTKRFEILEIS